MKLLAIATGTSFQELGYKLSRLGPEIKTIGIHRVFPYIKEVHNIDLDYWTWADPNAVTDGLDYLENNPNVKVPHIIIPNWLKTLDIFNREAGTSPINREPAKIKQYEEGVLKLHKEGKLTFIEKSINSRVLTEQGQVETIIDPEKRFDGNQIVFGTVPYDGRIAESQWGRENKFTFNIIPTAIFMGAKEVYCLGFDNRGGRITSLPGRDQMNHNNESIIKDYLSKFKPWVNEWKSYHGIDIYSVSPDKFTPNNTILEYKPIEDLLCMEKITFCIPSKSNLRYLKTCIPSIRNNASRSDHEIVIFVDQDEDGTIDWLEENKDKYNLTWIVNPMLKYGTIYGIGRAYDACIEKSTTDVFMIFHADMILGHNADLLAYNHLEKGTIVASTRIEPPLHPNGGEKILEAFGMYPEEFNEKLFGEFVEESANIDKTTNGIFAPWMMYKSDHKNIGGHDPRMHSCREDSDIFNRMSLAGYKFIQPWNSLVYHFTGRGAGSFSEDKARHEAWKVQMETSTREFTRKWKSSVKHTALMEPIITPIYNTAIIVKNCNIQLLTALEPWTHNVYVDCDYYDYIAQEKDNTIDDLFEKIKPIGEKPKNDILINIDGSTFNNQDFQFLQQIGDIIKNSGQIGKSKLGNILIEINQLNEIQNELCKM